MNPEPRENGLSVILDGYVDEPACLGVPPYISPYIRTVAGVLDTHGYSVKYLTIDQLRTDPQLSSIFEGADLLIAIAGVTVPGKYLGGTPATLTELRQIGHMVRGPEKLIGGPIGFGYAGEGGKKANREQISGFNVFLSGDPATALDNHLNGGKPTGNIDYPRSDPWSVAGASIIKQHPDFPFVMCEIETARGCSHGASGGCSFCTEPFYGQPKYRPISGISSEIKALDSVGAMHFRVGRQPDILTYGSGEGEYPAPRPDLLEELFSSIRQSAPGLKTLHIDNTNPATIARHEEKSREALAAIIRYHTEGDVAAFGMESADPAVVTANNLKAQPDEVFRAIEIVNEIGGVRRNGIPELLPGINFVCGLAGETQATYQKNKEFLVGVLNAGLTIRRVNIRQVMPFEGTPAFTNNTLGKNDRNFKAFKEFVRQNIDLPMLQRVFPMGTILRDLRIEVSGDLSFGRQMGTYPILVGVPTNLSVGSVIDTVVVDWGMRSVTALPIPININTLPATALRWIPGIGKKRVTEIISRRPFADITTFQKIVGNTALDSLLEV